MTLTEQWQEVADCVSFIRTRTHEDVEKYPDCGNPLEALYDDLNEMSDTLEPLIKEHYPQLLDEYKAMFDHLWTVGSDETMPTTEEWATLWTLYDGFMEKVPEVKSLYQPPSPKPN